MKKNSGKTENTGDGVKKDDEEQSRRFIEAAEKLEADKSGKSYRKVVESIIKKGG